MQELSAASLVLIALLVVAGIAMAVLWRAYRRSEEAHRRAEIRTQPGDNELAPHFDQLQALGRVLAGIAHDLNSTLSVVVMNLDVMQQDRGLVERHGRRLDNMMKAMQKGTNLTRHLLGLSHRHRPQMDVICLDELLPSVLELLQAALGKQIELETRVAGDLWNTQVDVTGFETAAIHLALATVGAAPAASRLTIELRNLVLDESDRSRLQGVEPGEHVLLVMTSSAMAPASAMDESPTVDSLDSEPGFRAAERFAGRCGGHLRVERNEGAGMRAALYLPRCRQETEV
jgi:signal transduction histidine kinase